MEIGQDASTQHQEEGRPRNPKTVQVSGSQGTME